MTETLADTSMPTPRLQAAWPEAWYQALTSAYLQADAASQIGDARHKELTAMDVCESLAELLEQANAGTRADLAWRVERLHAAAVHARQAQGMSRGGALGELADKLCAAMAEEPAAFA